MNEDAKKNIVAIIPARSGSKGIKSKNIIDFCGKPLLAWSIEQARSTNEISSVWVSSDGDEIIDISKKYGARTIKRPANISGDNASSESAWIHAIQEIENITGEIDYVIGMQATSPLRESNDLSNAIQTVIKKQYDSLLTVCKLHDFFIWKKNNGNPKPINYDVNKRVPRQEIEESFLENGSFYIFKPQNILKNNNRIHGKIGFYEMEKFKMFQIDDQIDIKICESIMRAFGLDHIE